MNSRLGNPIREFFVGQTVTAAMAIIGDPDMGDDGIVRRAVVDAGTKGKVIRGGVSPTVAFENGITLSPYGFEIIRR